MHSLPCWLKLMIKSKLRTWIWFLWGPYFGMGSHGIAINIYEFILNSVAFKRMRKQKLFCSETIALNNTQQWQRHYRFAPKSVPIEDATIRKLKITKICFISKRVERSLRWEKTIRPLSVSGCQAIRTKRSECTVWHETFKRNTKAIILWTLIGFVLNLIFSGW